MTDLNGLESHLTYEEAFPEQELILQDTERFLSYYLVTEMIPITSSGDQTRRTFKDVVIDLNKLDTSRFRVFLSSLPRSNAPLIVDDVLSVNGNVYGGWINTTNDPMQNLGRNPSVCYQPIEALNITRDARSDGKYFIKLLDTGGYTFCSSRIYLRVLRRQ